MLTTRQQAVLDYWVANPFATYAEISEKAKISPTQFYKYRQNQEFMQAYKDRCRKNFEIFEAKAMDNLSQLLDKKDWQATKYVLDGLDYGQKQKVDVSTNDIKITILE